MIHVFDIDKEKSLLAEKEAINDGLLNLGKIQIFTETNSSLGFQNNYLDNYSLRDKKNHDVDNTDAFPLNGTFDRIDRTSFNLQSGSFQQDLYYENRRMLPLGKTAFQNKIDADGPQLFKKITISSITTSTTTTIVTTSDHNLKVGDVVMLSDVTGETSFNGLFGLVIQKIDSTTVVLNINSSGYSGTPVGGTLRLSINSTVSITKGTTTLVTLDRPHTLSLDDYVVFYGISGMIEINGLIGKITLVPSNLQITVNINSTNFSTYKRKILSQKDQDNLDYSVSYGGFVSKMPTTKYALWANRLSSNYVYSDESGKVVTHNEDASSLKTVSFWRTVSKPEKRLAMKFYEFYSNLDISGVMSDSSLMKNSLHFKNHKQHLLDFEEFDYNVNTPEDFDNLKDRTDSDPELYSWRQNKKNLGYTDIHYDVQEVYYSDDNIYIQSTGIPDYLVSLNYSFFKPSNQKWTFQIPRIPEALEIKTPTPYGIIGVLKNGVPIFNYADGRSYIGRGYWNDNTVVSLKPLYDGDNGIVTLDGAYGHTMAPIGLYDESNTTNHSPLLGYALDGYPVYGPYGYRDYAPDDTGTTSSRVESGYTLRNITNRSTLPDDTVLNIENYGPPIVSYDYTVKLTTNSNLYCFYINGINDNGVLATLTSQRPSILEIDGVTPSVSDNVLIRNQFDPAENGIYTVTDIGSTIKSFVLTRVPPGKYGYSQNTGNKVLVTSGLGNSNTYWVLTGGDRLGFSSVVASKFDGYPLGYFIEDYEYTGDGSTTLDQYNGRYGRTPEYPNGIYAYFVTIDENEKPAFPYFIGPEYYGKVSELSVKNAGHSKIYDTVKNYMHKVLGLRIQILQNDRMYELTKLTPETWTENFSKSSSFGQRNENFFYNKTIALDSFATPKLLEDLDFDTTVEESLEFAGNVVLQSSNSYENSTINALRLGMRINPIFDSETGTWTDTSTGYRTYSSPSSYSLDISKVNSTVSHRFDTYGNPNPISIEMYSTMIIEPKFAYFEDKEYDGQFQNLNWEVYQISYGFGTQPFGETPFGETPQ